MRLTCNIHFHFLLVLGWLSLLDNTHFHFLLLSGSLVLPNKQDEFSFYFICLWLFGKSFSLTIIHSTGQTNKMQESCPNFHFHSLLSVGTIFFRNNNNNHFTFYWCLVLFSQTNTMQASYPSFFPSIYTCSGFKFPFLMTVRRISLCI